MELATVYFSSPERGRRTEYGLTAGELGGNSQGVFPTAPIQYRNQPVPVRSSIAGAPNFFLRWLQRMLRTEVQGPEGEHLGFFVRASTWNGVYQNRGERQPVVDQFCQLPHLYSGCQESKWILYSRLSRGANRAMAYRCSFSILTSRAMAISRRFSARA